MDSEPALPWGVAADAQRAIIRDLPAQMTLVVGSARIEVFWVLELADEDEEESQETTSYGKWWPATILRLDENGTTDGEGRIAYILCYDPDPESGYDEHTEHNVTFLDEHELFDIEEGEILMWRHECDDWNEVDKYRTEDGRYVISLEQIIEEDDKLARLVGIQPKSIREEMASCMEGMPMDVQRTFADKMDTSLAVFKEEVAKMMVAKKGSIVDLQDAHEMLESFKTRMGLSKKNKK